MANNASMAEPKKASERVRMIFDTTEELRRAVQIRAAARGETPSETINEILEDQFKPEIAIARREMKAQGRNGDDN